MSTAAVALEREGGPMWIRATEWEVCVTFLIHSTPETPQQRPSVLFAAAQR